MRSFLWFIFICLSAACAPAPYRTPGITPIPVTPQTTQLTAESCYYAARPTPTAEGPSLFAPVDPQEHILGPADAYLTIIEYSDFQCPSCARFAARLAEVQREHPQDIRIVYRAFPLISVYDKAALSAQAAEAAGLQGKFWEMHDALYEKQSEWAELSPDKFQAWAAAQAVSLGLDRAQFESDLSSPEMAAFAQNAWDEAMKIKLPGAPLILVNGEILKWQPTLLADLKDIIRLDLLPKRQFSTCPPIVIDASKQYLATLQTTRGTIVIRLFAHKAPNTVNNFVFLAQQGWYDNITFHRVVPGLVAQSGDPSGTGQGNPGYFIPDEIDRTLQYDRPGLLGMTNFGPDTNGSQFFITYAAAPSMNGKYTIFGQVLSGMDVLNQLTARAPAPGEYVADGDALVTVRIEEE